MASPVTVKNIIPAAKIKKELEELEDTLGCRLCTKTFCNEVAVRNHVRMEHADAYASGQPSDWMQKRDTPSKSKSDVRLKGDQKQIIKQRTEELISSMAPISLTSLASEDVSYIIIKAEDMESNSRKRKSNSEKSEKAVVLKKEKEPQPITGPFECLQPSNIVADGTCHQIFFSCCEYSTHYRDEHTRRRKGLRCQVCEKPLIGCSGDDLAPFPCQVCGSGYQNKQDLSEHINTAHVKLKPFECEICHKRFTQQGGVQQHMRMHTGLRPFPCSFCQKAFTQKSGLDQHLRIHTKVKPYRCVICEKTFCQSVHLKQHMRTHTNVSPFQCGICQKRFKQSSHLNYHLRSHYSGSMTEEQKEKYTELLGMIGASELVEVEVDQSQMTEQEIAEESIVEQQVVNSEDGYVVNENGSQWSIKIV